MRYEGPDSQFQVLGQPTGVWYYRVYASNSYGVSPWSNTETARVAPAAPQLLPIDNQDGDRNYLVDWSDVDGAISYRLEEAIESSFISPTVRYEGASSQFQVTGQYYGTWYYRVLASNAGGNSLWSNVKSVRVLQAPPDSPVLAPISNPDGNGDYLLDWNEVAGATSYRLEEADNSSFISPIVRYTGNLTGFQVTGQQSGVWYYRVLASNEGGSSPWSNTEWVGVIPAAPVLLPISNLDGNGDYLVDWNVSTGAASYRLEEAGNPGFISPTLLYEGAATELQINGRLGGTWYYRVLANNAGGDSPWSNTESANVIPAAPVLLPISNPDGNGDYLVDWNIVVGATSYRLEEAGNPSFISPTVLYVGAATELQINGQLGGTWYYRVLASNAGGDSQWSNAESVSVIPAAPVLLPISNPDGNGDYPVDWSDVTGATSYRLEESNSIEFSYPITLYEGAASQFQVTGQVGGTWYYRVLASNPGGDSPWSNIATVSVIPEAPVLLPIDNPTGAGDYLVDWVDVSGGDAYLLQEDDNPDFTTPIDRYTGTSANSRSPGRQVAPGITASWPATRAGIAHGRMSYQPALFRQHLRCFPSITWTGMGITWSIGTRYLEQPATGLKRLITPNSMPQGCVMKGLIASSRYQASLLGYGTTAFMPATPMGSAPGQIAKQPVLRQLPHNCCPSIILTVMAITRSAGPWL